MAFGQKTKTNAQYIKHFICKYESNMCSTSKEQFSGTKCFVIVFLKKQKIWKWLGKDVAFINFVSANIQCFAGPWHWKGYWYLLLESKGWRIVNTQCSSAASLETLHSLIKHITGHYQLVENNLPFKKMAYVKSSIW